MTAFVGSLEISVCGKKTVLELLHRVPGLDVSNPKAVAVPEAVTTAGAETLILTPVSLVLTKLYNLRQIPQDKRQDLFHLKISLNACRGFVSEALLQAAKFALWNCNRLIQAHGQPRNQRLEKEHGFKVCGERANSDFLTASRGQAKLAEEPQGVISASASASRCDHRPRPPRGCALLASFS